ncbi:MAG TPA: TadE/TadG family type IV pilus assembly protein [Candidatus Cybelea sp.]|nr:TadE/TadG family type IV pilus assembly protein [Candidatus Cybelea sp.]
MQPAFSRRQRSGVAHRGSTLPETVIVMSVLLALMFGIVDFGRAMYTYSFVAQLARQGARWAIVRGSDCSLLDHCNAQSSDVQTYVQSLNYGAAVSSKIAVTATWPGTVNGTSCTSVHAPGCVVSVNVQYPFTFLLPWVQQGNVWNLSSTSQMVVSN